MRQLFVMTALVVSLTLANGLAQAGKVEVKGPHLCCQQCVKTVGGILAKVDGVSDAKCDTTNKTVTFTAKDAKTAEAAVKALFEAGFFGAATDDGKAIKIEVGKATGKSDEVTVKAVHVCCGMCQSAIKGLFKDATVSFGEGKPQKDVKISAKGLDKAAVLDILRKAGFNGKID
jgi:copper chaperone CopZ